MVHGASATGQTVFMEPLETVETNNQLVQLGEDEAAEIVRIFGELTERLQRVEGTAGAGGGDDRGTGQRVRAGEICARF